MSKLTICGHSLGGVGALDTARADPRVKLCAVLDPWLYALNKEIKSNQFKLNVPLFIGWSEYDLDDKRFAEEGYDIWATFKTVFENTSCSMKENVII
jgi:pimeloyl-ACP methyl ester carboxylesterase